MRWHPGRGATCDQHPGLTFPDHEAAAAHLRAAHADYVALLEQVEVVGAGELHPRPNRAARRAAARRR